MLKSKERGVKWRKGEGCASHLYKSCVKYRPDGKIQNLNIMGIILSIIFSELLKNIIGKGKRIDSVPMH